MYFICPQVTTTSIEPSNELGAGGRIPSQEDEGPCHRRDSPRSAEFSGGSSGQFVAEKDSCKTVSPRFTISSIILWIHVIHFCFYAAKMLLESREEDALRV